MTMHYIPETTLTDYTYQGKREEEDLPASKTALTHRYNDSMITQENTKEDCLTTRNNTNNTMNNRMTITGKQNGKKNNWMGVLND